MGIAAYHNAGRLDAGKACDVPACEKLVSTSAEVPPHESRTLAETLALRAQFSCSLAHVRKKTNWICLGAVRNKGFDSPTQCFTQGQGNPTCFLYELLLTWCYVNIDYPLGKVWCDAKMFAASNPRPAVQGLAEFSRLDDGTGTVQVSNTKLFYTYPVSQLCRFV